MEQKVKLFDSELQVMKLLWKDGDTTAKDLALCLNKKIGWSKTTTYTIINKCITKGAITRSESGFMCHPEITHEQAQEYETTELINKMYDGSADKLVASLLCSKRLRADEISRLKDLVRKIK